MAPPVQPVGLHIGGTYDSVMTDAGTDENGFGGLELQSLRLIRAIADAGSLTAAAKELGLSQPAVSQQIRKVETRLGVSVVERVGRRVRLTDAGQVLARYSVTINTALAAAAEEIADISGMKSGRVRLAAFPTASSTIVPRLLSYMTQSHPGIRLTYVEAEPADGVEAVLRGSVDIAITSTYRGGSHVAELPGGLQETALWSDEMLVVLPAEHALAAEGAELKLSSFSSEKWIAGCPLCRGHLVDTCVRHGFAPNILFETDNYSAVTGMVAENLGVALVPRLALSPSRLTARIVARPLDPVESRTINIVHVRGADRVPAVAATLARIYALEAADWGLVPVS